MKDIKYPAWIWILALAFVAVNSVLIALEVFYLPILPALLLFFLVAFLRMDILLLAIVFFVPFSLPLSEAVQGLGIDMYLPTEPLLAAFLFLYVLRYFKGRRADLKLLRHPVSLAIYFYLGWMALTIITSSDPLVSVKFFLSKLWFIVGFYFFAAELFKEEKKMHTYVWMYVISFSVVILYTLVRHSGYGLDNQQMAHSMMKPFYKDHTSYGATLAFLLPVLIAFVPIYKGNSNARVLLLTLLGYFLFATVFSYTRAAWVGLVGAIGVWVVMKLRIRFEILAVSGVVLVALFFIFQSAIMMKLEDNDTRSSGDFSEHIKSITNISNDESNLERINRWSCAIRMWQEKPVFGFGPGTYQFEYGRFQRSFEKTPISTDFGIKGTAHSEYLGPLSETGLVGMLSVFFILIATIITGIRVYFNASSRSVKLFAMGILLGLITYYIHGILNNFLDTDKTSALFWGFTAMLVAMDVYHKSPFCRRGPTNFH